MARRRRILLVFFAIIVSVTCDQVTKSMADSYLPRKKFLSFAGDTLRFDFAVNKGGILSFEDDLPDKWQGPPFTVAAASFVVALIVFLLFIPLFDSFSRTALSLFCGGSLSNLYDRITAGSVVDFLNVGWGACRTSIFNVADVAITGGLFLFVLGTLIKVLWLASRSLRSPARNNC